MTTTLSQYDDVLTWVNSAAGRNGPHLILGNGFSVAYDANTFSYAALLEKAKTSSTLGSLSERFFDALSTTDFEVVIKQLLDAARALEIWDSSKYALEISAVREEAEHLKDALAEVLAGLHPDRPDIIPDESYARVRRFINDFGQVYTANYDLLLYWAVMHDDPADPIDFKTTDDGFRDPGHEADYVVWNYLKPHTQTIHYLHGALHLYRDADAAELQKLTWVRTNEPLIDQIRAELASGRYPLIVTEGSSSEKLAKIQTSDYLSKGLRSLAGITGTAVCYGLSLSTNDQHIADALIKSGLRRIAVSLYGSVDSDANKATIANFNRAVLARKEAKPNTPLDIRFFDSASAPLW
jgi:hypothetical protein